MFVFLLVLLWLSSTETVKSGSKLVIDHDGGADDAMAIFMALLYEEYYDGPCVIGLTTTHGNINETQVFNNTQRILDVAQRREIPIYRGSNSALVKSYPSDNYFGIDSLGDLENVDFEAIEAQPEHAAKALIRLSKEYEGQLIVAAIGALTNIALAIRLDPQFIERLAQIYLAAGNPYNESDPNPQYNAQMDVEAYYIVAQNSTPEKSKFVFSDSFSPDVTGRNISMEWRNNVLGSINSTVMQKLNQFERKSNAGRFTWNLLDPQFMSMVLNQSLVKETKCANNSIILCGKLRGINKNTFTDCKNSNINVLSPAPVDDFKTFLYNVFSASLQKSVTL